MVLSLRRRLPLFALLLALLAPFAPRPAVAAPPVFAQQTSDLPPDPAAVWGILPNGLHYVILPNHEPRARASLRLVVGSGSLYETDAQRGLAHFLEHMAFNGSTHYAPGTLVEFFQRMGMSFGGDTNAYTAFDRTVFMLELPDTQPATLGEGFQVFADFAGGLLLETPQVDKERGIILAEKRTRDSVDYRTYVAEYQFVLGESLFPQRMPIGLTKIIESAGRAEFEDLYNAWYRPDNLAVIAVGDFDPKAVEALIKADFGPVQPRAPERPQPDLGRIPSAPGLHVRFHAEPEAGHTTVSLETLTPYAGEPDTAANRLKYLPRDLAFAMLTRRLEILAKQENAPFTTGHANVDESYNFFRNAAVELTCKPEHWRGAVAVAEQELRRALEFGFQPAELTEATATYLNSLEQAAKSAATRRSPDLADDLVSCLMRDEVFTSPAEDLALLRPALEKVTAEDCLRAFRATWDVDQRYLFVAGNPDFASETAAPEEVITGVYNASHAVALQPPPKEATDAFAYTHFGAPGAVTHEEDVKDLDVHEYDFANGVRLNLKKTDFEANTIHVQIRLGTGRLSEPAATEPGLAFLGDLSFIVGGLGKHTIDDLQRLFASKTVGLNFDVGDDAFLLGGKTNREDLLAQLQLLAAYVTDPGYRPEALRQARKVMDQLYGRFAHTVSGPMQLEVPRLLASGDPRFGLPAPDVAAARTLDELRAWLQPQLADGPIEIAIAGDLDPDATVAAVAQTFGALPPRVAKPPLDAARAVKFPAPFARTYTVPTEIPKALVTLYWPTTDARDVNVARRLILLSEILSDRLRVKIREQMGDAYSPEAFSAPSDTYRDYGFLLAQVTTVPAQAPKIVDTILAIAADLQKNGATPDELERAKAPILTSLKESARTNAYWLNSVIGSCQEFPQRLDWCRSRFSDFQGITKAEVDALAARYLDPARTFRVVVLPRAPDAPSS
ncbi:MAG TPA: insulinase family protein [Opitutaceae bacterium]|nr:insulinase family protein [Opitutaceae bacterium]